MHKLATTRDNHAVHDRKSRLPQMMLWARKMFELQLRGDTYKESCPQHEKTPTHKQVNLQVGLL
jgi:hypothetical protein